ncbi:hypothetical protein PULV_a2175 [Pseudoalteromonas ulvae UL12]|uniref:GNAT family N-acetyltransferase n=1 Tax=Pseudoalteromonas ulvae TaxID=107327 RepID=UPI00186B6D7F|nr:GNAT family N-acetyltransferase [Pseudoalteromonas ulvae]MBE0365391.1 hypothetical protein [Pseudoalteromonas ulvae UL12]
MQLTECEIVQLDALKTPLVNKFYDRCRAKGRAKKHDNVWVVYYRRQIIAACRIQSIDCEYFLSTVMVEPAYRGQGLARFFILNILSQLSQPLVTFAYSHLRDFYSSLGFTEVDGLSTSLSSRFNQYQKQQSNLLAMSFVP